MDKMKTSDTENHKMDPNVQSTLNSKEGLSSCKRPRTPLVDLKIKGASPRSMSSRLAISGKGLRTRKSSPHKTQLNGVVQKSTPDKARCSFGFTPIGQNRNSTLDGDSRAFSPMDVACRTSSPMECSNGPCTSCGSTKFASPCEGENVAFKPKIQTNLNRRIGYSLDMVDLWDPDSDSESENTSDKYDSINGVTINPRKTINFSELRKFRRKDIPDMNEETELQDKADGSKEKREPKKKEGRTKPKLRMTQNMKALLTYPPASPSSADCPCNITFEDYRKQVDRKSSKTTKQNQSEHRTIPILTRASKKLPKEETSPSLSRSRKSESSPLPPQQRMLNVTYDFSDELSTSPKRVNFNNFVTVEDGEMSTLEMLKSSNNSAQLIKQKYLGKYHQQSAEPEPHQAKDLSPRDDVLDIQLAKVPTYTTT